MLSKCKVTILFGRSQCTLLTPLRLAEQSALQAFLVPEILEAIVLQLPIRALLVEARRVCRHWKTTIDSSISVQQALFFHSEPASSSSQVPHLNSLLQTFFPAWFRTDSAICNGAAVKESLPWASDPKTWAAFMRADASWRNMLPCQPAKRLLKVTGKKNVKEGIFEMSGRVIFEEGVRMGQLYDLGFDIVREHVSSFWIQWDEASIQGSKEDENQESQLTMYTEHSWFKCGPGTPPDVGDEFRSEAYEKVRMDMKEEIRTRHWHGGFGQPPNGGWSLP